MSNNGYVDTGESMVGIKPIDLSLSQGAIAVAVTMQSVDDQTTVALPQDTQITTASGGDYTGVIM